MPANFGDSSIPPLGFPSFQTEPFAQIIEDLATAGFSITPDFLDFSAAQLLAEETRRDWEEGEFRRAGVGRGEELQVRNEIRRDHVRWLENDKVTGAQALYLEKLDALRQALNRQLFLGLQRYEGHFAVYPPGAFYKAHLDRPRGSEDRWITTILYLNSHWQEGDGGELKLQTEAHQREGNFLIIPPRLGTLVTFLSGDFWHEVLPSKTDRLSITGWFCRRDPFPTS